jgi:LPXTG-motif cell wall-anchored protein
MKRSYVFTFLATALVGVLNVPTLRADPVYRLTEVTFAQPVEIPGMVLPAGTYVLKLLDPYMDQDIVRFYNPRMDHMYAMVFAVRDYRLVATNRPVITLEERAHGAPPAIKTWFASGENWGEEFVYRKVHPIAAVEQPAAPAPKELQPAQPTVTEAPEAQPAPVAEAAPAKEAPIEIAQVEIAPAPAAPAPAEIPAELPKTGTDLPLIAIGGAFLLLTGAVLRLRAA